MRRDTTVRSPRARAVASALLGGFLLLAACTVFASQAVVWSHVMPDVEIGQAWLLRYGERCLAVTPEHVLTEAGRPGLRGEGGKERGELDTVTGLGADRAFGTVAGGLATRCGPPVATISRNVTHLLKGGAIGALRSLNGDGTVARLAVVVVDDDGEGMLRVLPTGDGARIRKGQSGSLLLIGDVPVGMLLSVNTRSGVGNVVRVDALVSALEAHLRSEPVAPLSGATGPGTRPAAGPEGSWAIARWSVDPVSSASSARNLLLPDPGQLWHARVPSWPVELELHRSAGTGPLAGFDVVAAPSELADARPRRVEIVVTPSAASSRWRPLGVFALDYGVEGTARLRFAPTRAGAVRLRFMGEPDATQVALASITILDR